MQSGYTGYRDTQRDATLIEGVPPFNRKMNVSDLIDMLISFINLTKCKVIREQGTSTEKTPTPIGL